MYCSLPAYRLPNGFDGNVGVVSRYDIDILNVGVSQLSPVGEQLDVGVRYMSRVLRGIGEVDISAKRDRFFGCRDDGEVANFGLEGRSAVITSRKCCCAHH